MPSLGADMEAGTLLEWYVKPGDTVKRGDIVARRRHEQGRDRGRDLRGRRDRRAARRRRRRGCRSAPSLATVRPIGAEAGERLRPAFTPGSAAGAADRACTAARAALRAGAGARARPPPRRRRRAPRSAEDHRLARLAARAARGRAARRRPRGRLRQRTRTARSPGPTSSVHRQPRRRRAAAGPQPPRSRRRAAAASRPTAKRRCARRSAR